MQEYRLGTPDFNRVSQKHVRDVQFFFLMLHEREHIAFKRLVTRDLARLYSLQLRRSALRVMPLQ